MLWFQSMVSHRDHKWKTGKGILIEFLVQEFIIVLHFSQNSAQPIEMKVRGGMEEIIIV